MPRRETLKQRVSNNIKYNYKTVRKKLFRLWMLALPMLLGLASCSDNDDNPVTDPDEP